MPSRTNNPSTISIALRTRRRNEGLINSVSLRSAAAAWVVRGDALGSFEEFDTCTRVRRILSEFVFVLLYGSRAKAFAVGLRLEIDRLIPFGKRRLGIEPIGSDIGRCHQIPCERTQRKNMATTH